MPRVSAPQRPRRPATQTVRIGGRRPTAKTALAAPYVAVVLDETSSMAVVKGPTISAYNEYLATLQRDPSAVGARFTVTRFNTLRTQTDGPADIAAAVPLTDETYRPAAMTDLHDAVGRTIHRLDADAPKGPVIVVILTDGEENSSREYRPEQIRALIKERQDTGRWTFVFLGANQDAWQAGASLGIPRGNTMAWRQDAVGTNDAVRAAATGTMSVMSAYARSDGTVTTSRSFMADAGIDKCLACGTRLVLGEVHACVAGPKWTAR